MHQGRPHFDPTMALPEDGWASFQGVQHQYPADDAPLELTAMYGPPSDPGMDFIESLSSFDPYSTAGLLESLPDPDAPFRAREEDPDDDTLWRKLRRLVEPQDLGETAALIGASFIPPLDQGIDMIDLMAAIEDRDISRAAFAIAGLGLPVAGRNLKELVDGVEIFKRDAPRIEGTRPQSVDQPNPTAPTPRSKPSELSQEWASNPQVQEMVDETVEAGLEATEELKDVPWYETGGLYQAMPEGSPGMTFDEFHLMGAALSPQTPVDEELMFTSLVNFARQNNVSIDEAYRVFADVYPNTLFHSGRTAQSRIDKAMGVADAGWISPMRGGVPAVGVGAWKTPAYAMARMGMGSLNPNLVGGVIPWDTHMMGHANYIIQQIPELRRLALDAGYAGGLPKQFSVDPSEFFINPAGTKQTFLGNAPTYQEFSKPYVESAKTFGLPTVSAAQGAAWEGGRGLGISIPKTAPGTFQGLTEQMIREANRLSNLGFGNIADLGITGGYPDTAEGLLQFFQEMREGRRFLPMALKDAASQLR